MASLLSEAKHSRDRSRSRTHACAIGHRRWFPMGFHCYPSLPLLTPQHFTFYNYKLRLSMRWLLFLELQTFFFFSDCLYPMKHIRSFLKNQHSSFIPPSRVSCLPCDIKDSKRASGRYCVQMARWKAKAELGFEMICKQCHEVNKCL